MREELGKQKYWGKLRARQCLVGHLEEQHCSHSRKNKPIILLQLVNKHPCGLLWHTQAHTRIGTGITHHVNKIHINVGMLVPVHTLCQAQVNTHQLSTCSSRSASFLLLTHLLILTGCVFFISWMCICHFFSFRVSVNVYQCVSVSVSVCVFLFPKNRSPDTEKQQVKAIFWRLLVAIGRFVRPAQIQAYCVCV